MKETSSDPAAILADFEARARRYETPCGDGMMVWRAWGDGPPVLLAHGAQGAWSHWVRNIDALAQRRTVWVPDLPGSGDSAMPPGEGHEALSAVLAEGLRSLPDAQLPMDMVGFSFGGVALAWLAALQPELARRLVIVDSGGLETRHGGVDLVRVRHLTGAERQAAHAHNLLGLMLHARTSVDAMALHLQETNVFRGRLNVQHYVLPDRLLHILPRVPVQVDAIWGEYDRPHPDPHVQEAVLRAIFPDMEFRVIEGAGHWSMFEGAEGFNAALIAMLDQPLRV